MPRARLNSRQLGGATSEDVQLKAASSKSHPWGVVLELISPWVTEPVTVSHTGQAGLALAERFPLAFDLAEHSHNINSFGIYFPVLSWVFEIVHCACLGNLLAAASAEERLALLAAANMVSRYSSSLSRPQGQPVDFSGVSVIHQASHRNWWLLADSESHPLCIAWT